MYILKSVDLFCSFRQVCIFIMLLFGELLYSKYLVILFFTIFTQFISNLLEKTVEITKKFPLFLSSTKYRAITIDSTIIVYIILIYRVVGRYSSITTQKRYNIHEKLKKNTHTSLQNQ